MYDRENYACGKEDERETACTTAETVRAERKVGGKEHVQSRELYMRKRAREGKRIHTGRVREN